MIRVIPWHEMTPAAQAVLVIVFVVVAAVAVMIVYLLVDEVCYRIPRRYRQARVRWRNWRRDRHIKRLHALSARHVDDMLAGIWDETLHHQPGHAPDRVAAQDEDEP